MGIINATPDSFSGDGVGTDLAALGQRVEAAVAAGCHILDVGAESTRPGSQPIGRDEELARLLPAIAKIRTITALPLSVDTYKADVAAKAIEAGANMINDITALAGDPAMGAVAAEIGCPVILMHRSITPVRDSRLGRHFAGMETDSDVVAMVAEQLCRRREVAEAAGIDPGRLICDPGIGFGKDPGQNLALLNGVDRIRSLVALPLLIGASRKSVIAHALKDPDSDRLAGTIAAHTIAIARGADIVRVHDFRSAVQAARLADAVSRPT